ncbi:hypothetical protein AYO44_08340 [Planctomycetaceae bacterium SCGC AG-212-F19]|nr:hypothetical protein AYO44_08340 [Planctomycetaceae bacterium SCGC AG-212-F19]
MKYLVFAALLAILLISGMPIAAAPPAGKDNLAEQVRKAIEEGKKFLRAQQVDVDDVTGHWEIDINSKGRRGGWTSLALLALLNAGEDPKSKVVQRGLTYLRTIEPADTYVVGLQTMVFAEAGFPQDLARIQRNVDWLVQSRVTRGIELLGWGYRAGGQSADNSNTQYALLGLWAGRAAGARIDRTVWESIRDFYVRTQDDSGGWFYIPAYRTATLTMSTAGVCGLMIAGQELNADQQQLQKNGVALKCGLYPEDKALAKGMEWVTGHFQVEVRHHLFYNLYGIERAGRLSGQRFIGDHDWYREGCQYLVRMQQDDGSWYLRGQGFDTWPVISTSFSLLFLSKGRTPILISKLVHGSPDNPTLDWNRKHNDMRNLTEHVSKELFKRQPLGWQIFNAREVRPNNHEEVLSLVGELLPSPIAYFSGHNEPLFTNWEKDLLKRYVDQGGFILAEACCGSPAFDTGFRKLMKEMFPDNPLTELNPNHPIWRSHPPGVAPGEFKLYGIELGCKTVVVYSPQPISGFWEANQSKEGRGRQAFLLGTNIVAYATGLEMPKPKGFHVDVPGDKPEAKVPRGYLKLAQLKTGDRWRSAANGVKNLMLDLRKNARMDVALKTEELFPDDKDLFNFKVMYMHGREDFTLSNVTLLKANIETGGTLFADACCGRKDFDKAFRQLMEQMFKDKKLEPIPVTDDLFSKELNGTAITSVRCRREKPDGSVDPEYRQVPPALEGIKIDGRWAVIYSKYDIGCALEKHTSPDCLGHDHDSALKLAGAIVLYALQR